MVHLACNVAQLQYSSMFDNKELFCDVYIVDSKERINYIR